jgi:hypothetical protein
MNKFTNYRDYAKEVEARLNRAVKFPVPCMVYERVRGEINRVMVSPTAPQINLSFRALNSKINQTIYYFYNGKPQVKFENYSYTKEFTNWQHALEAAFNKLPEVPDPAEVPELIPEAIEEPVIETTPEVQEEPIIEAIPEIVEEEPVVEDVAEATEEVEDTEDPVEESLVEQIQDVSPAEFIAWAVENLRTMTEDKASFKKDIPEEFSLWAATKRTITDGELLRMLADACPVTEE